MFGIGSTELILILLVALVILGPKNLPKVANSLGRAMGEFRKASTDFQRNLNMEIAVDEENEKKKQNEAAKAEPTAASSTEDKHEPESGPKSE